MLACLKAVETLGTLLLLQKDVFGAHCLVFEIGQHLDAKLVLSVQSQIEVSVVLASKPIGILLTLDDLGLVSRVCMKIRIPWLIKSLHGEEGVWLSLGQHIVCKNPEAVIYLIESLDG